MFSSNFLLFLPDKNILKLLDVLDKKLNKMFFGFHSYMHNYVKFTYVYV